MKVGGVQIGLLAHYIEDLRVYSYLYWTKEKLMYYNFQSRRLLEIPYQDIILQGFMPQIHGPSHDNTSLFCGVPSNVLYFF